VRLGILPALPLALVTVLAAAACQGGLPAAGAATTATPSASAGPSSGPSPTPPPVDPLATVEVCGLAAAATATTITIFNEQIAALEQAAARNDQTAMVAAAKAINQQFVSLGEAFAELAERPVEAQLRIVLTDIAIALEQMSSLSYTGTTVDIRKKLVDFTLAIQGTCAAASAVPSLPAG
jgi:hypothetical protein